MKKLLYIIPIVLILSSCMKEPDFNIFTVELNIPLNEEITSETIVNAKVLLNNLQKGYSNKAFVDSTGKVVFTMVEPGFYSATLSHTYGSGVNTSNLNGLIEIEVFTSVEDTLPVVLSTSNAFVIKEFYYSASLTPAGNQYTSDQYIEIFNNSAELKYADGISIIEHESYGIGTNFWNYMSDSIVVKMIWTIPGDGDDCPIDPGRSIVIARDAFDHRDDPNGNPLCPVNMGNADFEFWVDHPSGSDIDYPGSPNMIEDLFVFRGSDVCFHTRGGSAIALVYISVDPEERKNYIDNNLVRKRSSNGTSTRWYCRISNDMVLDAVEVVFDEAHAVYKRFPIELDVGYTYVPAGSKSGKCVRRNIKHVVDGRTVYQDTNNSTEDFEKDADPKPWIYE